MKSVCIKTNNNNSINYLLKLLDSTQLENMCFSENKFKNYKNVIIHYSGNLTYNFISTISEILSFNVIENYEKDILKRLISTDYFYFDAIERESILQICIELLSDTSSDDCEDRYILLYNNFFNYLSNQKNIVLDGFINFRVKNYLSYLNSKIDMAVNKFIVEREYWEFISLLKVYINSEPSTVDYVHLIYDHSRVILLDQEKNLIEYNKDVFRTKYLSDISFSNNDYALNTLLNIIPKKIYIHLSNEPADEFINTLLLIFENRTEICNDCPLCTKVAIWDGGK